MLRGSFGLRQFRQESCLSYIVYDRATGQAMVVDPRLELINDYSTFSVENKLRIEWAIDTRTHSDHLSATHLFSQGAQAVQVGMSARTQSERLTQRLSDGAQIQLGEGKLEIVEVPGASTDSVALRGPGWILTGDSLWAGCSVRLDLPGSDPLAYWAGVRRLLENTPGETLLFTGHDELGLVFSTVEVERKRNAAFRCSSREEFAALKAEEKCEHFGEDGRQRLRFNQEKSPQGGSGSLSYLHDLGRQRELQAEFAAPLASISIDKFRRKLEDRCQGTMFVDVRERPEFDEGHIPGMECVSLSELGFKLSKFKESRRVYVCCLTGVRSTLAVRTLTYLGLADVVLVNGGLKAWIQAGFPVQTS